MVAGLCLSQDVLAACAAGTLDDGQAESVFAHIGDCPDCLAKLDRLSATGRSLAEGIREIAAETHVGLETPPPLRQAMDRLVQSPFASPDSSFGSLNSTEVVFTPGSRVGDYQLAEEIGRGGLGRVYRATHPRLGQQVAVKMLGQAVPSDEARTRFEAEWQTLSRMDHPHIAHILDGGLTDDGRPFFVLELIRGSAITHYCDEHRLTVRERVTLFLQVCQAVQHAHQKAVIHRDIKPSNVMVAEYDGRPVVKVIDFGIARLQDKSPGETTQDGMLIGTPEYASPEQASLTAGGVDIRSDVFSLGVLLYELLCGRTPFRRDDEASPPVLEWLRRIRDEDAPSPAGLIRTSSRGDAIATSRSTTRSTLAAVLEGELTWIVLKSIEKPPERRYETVAALADDLRRCLDDQPVAAGPPSRWYRFRKAVSRNRGVAIAVALLLLALVAGTVGTTAGLITTIRERNEKADALASESRERTEKEQALELERQSRVRADEAVERTLTALQTLTEDTVSRLLSARPTMTDSDRKFLDNIVTQYEEFSKSTNNSLKARIVEAEGHHRIASLRERLGDTAQAVEHSRKAIDLWQPICKETPERHDLRRAMANSHSNLGIYLAGLRKFPESEEAHRTAIAMHESLAKEFPAEKSYRKNVANCRTSYGVMLKDVQRNVETIEQYRLAIEIQKQLLADDPENQDLLSEHATARNNMGIELLLAGKTDESLIELQETAELRRKLVANSPDDPDEKYGLASTYGNIGMLFGRQQQFEEGAKNSRLACDLLTKVSADFPAVVTYRKALANNLNALSTILSASKQYVDTIDTSRQYIDVASQLLRDDPDDAGLLEETIRVQLRLASGLSSLKRTEEALQAGTRAVELARDHVQSGRGGDDARIVLAKSLIRQLKDLKTDDAADQILACMREATSTLDAVLAKDSTNASAASLRQVARFYTAVALAVQSANQPEGESREMVAREAISILQLLHGEGYFQQPTHRAEFARSKGLQLLKDREDFRRVAENVANIAN